MKFRLRILFAILGCVVLFQGCTTSSRVGIARTLRKHGLEKQMKLRHPETGREIIMIGMIHIEKPEFFEEIKEYLDSVKREGYVVFYEGVRDGEEGADPCRIDTVLRKFRRVAGLDVDYFYTKQLSYGKYVMQSLERLGLSTDRDINVDMTIDEMVTAYEKEYEEISLTDYDWQTDLSEKYKWRKSGKQRYNEYAMIHTLRDRHIIENVDKSPYDKIVLLYGASHWFNLYPPFRDAGYEVVEGKPYPSYKPQEDE